MEVQEDAVQVFRQEISSCRLLSFFLSSLSICSQSYWLEVEKNIKKDPPQLLCLFPSFVFILSLPEFSPFLSFSLYSHIFPTQETSWCFPFLISCPSIRLLNFSPILMFFSHFSSLNLPKTPSFLSSTNILGLVVFAVVTGIAIAQCGEDGKPLLKFFESISIVMMKVIKMT